MNRRHFLIYYDHRTLEITKTTPRTWAKANQGHFPAHDFINTHPTTNEIGDYLQENYHFEIVECDEYIVLHNLHPNIPIANGLQFVL